MVLVLALTDTDLVVVVAVFAYVQCARMLLYQAGF